MPAATPAISVILPVRNSESTVAAAVKCILSQTMADFELLFIDDGTTAEIPTDPRIRVFKSGRGLVHAINLGLAEARAPLVARMDADDECSAHRLERSLAALSDDLVGVGTQVEIFRDDQPVSPNLKAYGAWLNSLTSPDLLFRDRFVESPLCNGSTLLRREALVEVGGWRDGDFPEDWELFLRLLESGKRLSCVPEVLYRWRDHSERVTRKDPRYARDRHLALKARFLSRHRRVEIAGAGETGLRLSRLLRTQGVEVTRFIDVNPKKIGQRIEGIPVVGPDDVGSPQGTHLIAAAGSKGAREEIRDHLNAHGWKEGRDFTSAA